MIILATSRLASLLFLFRLIVTSVLIVIAASPTVIAQSPVTIHLQADEAWLIPYFDKHPEAAYRVVQTESERAMSFVEPGDVTLVRPAPGKGNWYRLSHDKKWIKLENPEKKKR